MEYVLNSIFTIFFHMTENQEMLSEVMDIISSLPLDMKMQIADFIMAEIEKNNEWKEEVSSEMNFEWKKQNDPSMMSIGSSEDEIMAMIQQGL